MKYILKKKYLNYLIIILLLCLTIGIILAVELSHPSKAYENNIKINDIYLKCNENTPITYVGTDHLDIENVMIDNTNVAYCVDNVIYAVHSGETTMTVIVNSSSLILKAKIVVSPKVTDLNLSLSAEETLYVLDKNIQNANLAGYYNTVSFSSDYLLDVKATIPNILEIDISQNKITALAAGECEVLFTCLEDSCCTKIIKFKVYYPPVEINCEDEISLQRKHSSSLEYTLSNNFYYCSFEYRIMNEDLVDVSISDSHITFLGKNVGYTTVYIYNNNILIKSISVVVTSIDYDIIIENITSGTYEDTYITVDGLNVVLKFTTKEFHSDSAEVLPYDSENIRIESLINDVFEINAESYGEYLITVIFDTDMKFDITIRFQ